MDHIIVKEVVNRQDMNDFVKFGNHLYADCPYYVPDLENDIRDFFNPEDNPGLAFCDVQPFMAYDRDGNAVGRVAAVINHHANEKWNVKTVRFCFIDFIEDIDAASALLGAVETWGRERGMLTVQGPMGITDFDKEGMLIDDFDKMGSIITIYNFPYYPKYLESLGYEKEVDWINISIDVPDVLPEKFVRVARLASEKFGLRIKKVDKTEILKLGYGQKIFQLLNTAYSPLFGYSELSPEQVDYFINHYLVMMDTRCLSLVENNKGDLVGVAITMADMSSAMRKTKGRLLPFGWYYLFKAVKIKHSNKLEMLLIAVRPDYQGCGVNALLFEDIFQVCRQCGFTSAETGPQLENNMKEISQWRLFNPSYVKRRRCFKKDL